MNELKGVGVAMVTPFQSNGEIDFEGLERLVKHLHKGAHFLVVMGTTGEAVTLSEEEQFSVLDRVLEINAGKLPVVMGMGGNDTARVVEKMSRFDRKGVSAFLSASPAYNKPTQEGIYRHYLKLSEASNLPIILYNVPGRTASNVLPETVKRIARDAKKVKGIKEAAVDMEQVMDLAYGLPEEFLLLSGDDPLFVPHMACGGDGIITVVGNAFPAEFRAVYEAAVAGNYSEARRQHYRLRPLIDALFAEGNPGGIKEVLKRMGICGNTLRLPLYPVSESLSERMGNILTELNN